LLSAAAQAGFGGGGLDRRRAGRVDGVTRAASGYPPIENGKEAVGSERAEEQRCSALAIVDELTSDAAKKAVWSLVVGVDFERRPVFAKTVGEDAVAGFILPGMNHVWAGGFDRSNRLDRNRSLCVVLHGNGNAALRQAFVEPNGVCQAGLIRQSGAVHGRLRAGAEGIVEGGFVLAMV